MRILCFFFSSRRRHTRFDCDWSSDVCSSDLMASPLQPPALARGKIDLGLAHSYVGVGGEHAFAHHRIAEDRVDAALLSSGHPLAQRRKLQAADLADVPFLFPERAFHPGLYDLVLP